MKKLKNFVIILILIITIFSSIGIATSVSKEKNNLSLENEIIIKNQQGFYNITVFETWEILNQTLDTKPVLIDVRRIEEYVFERINPPHPSDWPRWFPYQYRQNINTGAILNEGFLLKIFINYFQNNDMILYCRTGRRSYFAAQILVDNDFNGEIYNMIGGIVEWKNAGFPTSKIF